MPATNKHIMLVDDDEDDRMIFRDILGELGTNVKFDTANNGETALRLLANFINLPDIIFIDINMPKIDGQECLIRMRQNKRYDDVLLVMYSTSSNPIIIEQLMTFGANGYIIKPCAYNVLRETVGSTMKLLFAKNFNRFTNRLMTT
ncbi:MAG: response regulator [Psychroserpens sp.]|uniref:response regulator n=1 Tax=Psychroserpens sp. TaxID=2020870 RepID=UPI003C77A2C1